MWKKGTFYHYIYSRIVILLYTFGILADDLREGHRSCTSQAKQQVKMMAIEGSCMNLIFLTFPALSILNNLI